MGRDRSRRLIDVDRPRADHLEVVADGLDGDPLSGADVEDLIAARGLTDVDIARRHDLTIVRNLLNTISLGRFRTASRLATAPRTNPRLIIIVSFYGAPARMDKPVATTTQHDGFADLVQESFG